MKCKICFSAHPDVLSATLQRWLHNRNRAVTVRAVSAGATEYGYCVSVFYEETAGPQYRVAALAAWRHDALEAAVNQALAADSPSDAPMVAMASSRRGHCIVLLWADHADHADQT
jgi:hypothetical protein